VHRALGPGLLESAYEACLAYELLERRRRIERQTALPVGYRGARLDWVDKTSGLSDVESVDEEPGARGRRAFRRALLLALPLTFAFLWAWFDGRFAPLGLQAPAFARPEPEAPAPPPAAPAPEAPAAAGP